MKGQYSGSVTVPILILLVCASFCPFVAAAGQEGLLQPGDLEYKGAFRLPHDSDGWGWGGTGLTYYPGGDPDGTADGYPGSLYGMGNDQLLEVSEVSIPAPVISPTHSTGDLLTATTLQPFTSLTGSIFTPADDGLPLRGDLEYLPAQDGQTSGKLHITWGEHYQYELVPSHAWSELTLSHPGIQGPWYLNGYENYATNDYLFEIPDAWAQANTPGLLLATGRFRDGSLGGSGPSLFAYGPWLDGNPPAAGSRLTHVTPLLLYGKGYEEESRGHVMEGYTNADEWSGGAWLTSGSSSAVVFAGTKGRGKFWYGFSNGVVWPENGPYPDYPPAPHDDRGWWADSFEGVLYFYNPADLAKAAAGTMETWEPQPYAQLSLEPYLWHITDTWQKMRVGAVAFDRERGYLYIAEPFADGDQPIIHVFAIKPGSAGTVATQSATTAMTPVAAGTTTALSTAVTGYEQEEGEEATPQSPGFCTFAATAALAGLALIRRYAL